MEEKRLSLNFGQLSLSIYKQPIYKLTMIGDNVMAMPGIEEITEHSIFRQGHRIYLSVDGFTTQVGTYENMYVHAKLGETTYYAFLKGVVKEHISRYLKAKRERLKAETKEKRAMLKAINNSLKLINK